MYFTADTHFNHKNIIQYCNRPFQTVEEMNETLIQNWNNVVRTNDIIFHLGDFGFGKINKSIDILKRLNGKKYLITGNHDKKLNNEFKSYFEFVRSYYEIKDIEPNIVLNHYSSIVWHKQHHGTWLLYGHHHGKLKESFYRKSMDVGIDCHPYYRPFHYDEIKEILNNRG